MSEPMRPPIWPPTVEAEAVHQPRRRRDPPGWRVAVAAVTLAAMAGVYLLAPDGMPEPARRTLAVFVFAAVFWATELIPLYATSLAVVVMQVLLLSVPLLLPDAESIPARSFLAPFASEVILLFLGGFLIARAVAKHGVDRTISAALLAPTMRSPLMLVMGGCWRSPPSSRCG